MEAHWISDGTEVPAEPLQCEPGAKNRWRIGSYEFERWSRGRWGCCYRNDRGVANCRSPVAAFFALRRWLREPSVPCE